MTESLPNSIDTEHAVRERYAAAARAVEPQLCCPVEYDARFLEVIPAEVIERDYGCGDPSRHVMAGETVLDLGSGGGKICFIAAQVVGPQGRVIGVDMNDAMLDLARRSQASVATKIGYDNVTFHKGKIQDLAVDQEAVEAHVREFPVTDADSLRRFEAFVSHQKQTRPLIADRSVDVVVSNCVLNLVDSKEKLHTFGEIHRVLRDHGRAVISDIVSDRPVPSAMQSDPELWSGCISGAMEEAAFAQAFRDAGFSHVQITSRQADPWRTVEGIEFRSVTVVASKRRRSLPLDGECCGPTGCC